MKTGVMILVPCILMSLLPQDLASELREKYPMTEYVDDVPCDDACGAPGGMCDEDGRCTSCPDGYRSVPGLETCKPVEICETECGPSGGKCVRNANWRNRLDGRAFKNGYIYCVECGEGYWWATNWAAGILGVRGESCGKLEPCEKECGKGGLCLIEQGEKVCKTCKEGYALDGRRCKKLDTCEEECGCPSTCVREDGQAKCLTCGPGFESVQYDPNSANITCIPQVETC